LTRKHLVAAAIALLCTVARAGSEYRFKGETIEDHRDGFTVVGKKDDGLLAVASNQLHYILMLPFAEDWTFTTGEPALLKGNSGLTNLTLSVEACAETPEQHLRTLQAALAKSGDLKGVEKSEVVTFRDEPVLRVVMDGEVASGKHELHGVKMVHFYTAKRWGRVVYVLHLSRVIPAKEVSAFDEKPLLSFVTLGFRVDFMREEGKNSK
jgi:hypothetical protein